MSARSLIPRWWARPGDGNGDPFAALQARINRLFGGFEPGIGWEPLATLEQATTFAPRVDVRETAKEITVTAEVPGLDEKNIEVTLQDNHLYLKGEKKFEKEEKEENCYVLERSYGAFERVLPLPSEVDAEKVLASFKNGVLTVKLAKTEAAKQNARKIAVKAG